jgi:hypothetical protein
MAPSGDLLVPLRRLNRWLLVVDRAVEELPPDNPILSTYMSAAG